MSTAAAEEIAELESLGAKDIQIKDSGYLTYRGICRYQGEVITVEGFTHWSATMGLISKIRRIQMGKKVNQ